MKQILSQFTSLLLIGLFSILTAHAQQAPSEATNIRISTDAQTKRLVIQYDLPSVQPTDSLYVEIETATGRRFRPAAVTGNVGKTLTPGVNKTIYWDVVRDNIKLEDEEVEVIIRISRVGRIARPVPAASPKPPVPAPVVAVRKKSALPVVGWIATAALGGYAYTLSSGLNKDVAAYNLKNVAQTLPEWNAAETQRKDIDSRQGMFTVVAGATAVLAVANVVWLVARKSKNARTAWQIRPRAESVQVGFIRKF